MKREKLNQLTLTALFVALILLLGMTPLGLIPLPWINVTILCIPVIVGTILLGLRTGLLLGGFFGLVSALSAFGLTLTPPSTLAASLVAKNAALAVIMCFVPRLMVPIVTWGVFRLVGRGEAKKRALPFAAVAGSFTNTILYLSMMYVFYRMSGLDYGKILVILTGTGLIAGSSEAAVAAVVATPLVTALWAVQKKTS